MVNKRYHQLSDLEWLRDKLRDKSMSQLATELSAEFGWSKQSVAASIRFMVQRYFTKDEIKNIKREREFHKNKKRRYQ